MSVIRVGSNAKYADGWSLVFGKGKAAATTLTALSAEYHAARCPSACVQTARPPECKPTCAGGVCR